MLVCFRQVEHDGPWVRAVAPMNPDHVGEHPSCRRVLKAFAVWVWKCGLMCLEGLANPLRQGRLDHQADGHHPQQRHDRFGLVEIPRGGPNLWGFQAAHPAFRLGVALITGAQRRRGEAGVSECLGSEDDTTGLGEQGLTGGDPPGARAVALRDELGRWWAVTWAPRLVIAWGGAEGALGHDGGLHALGKACQGLLRIGGTGQGRAAQLLARWHVLRTVLQPRLVHGALRLRLARR